MASTKGGKRGEVTAGPGASVVAPPPANMPEGFTIKRQITLPSLAIKVAGTGRVLHILDAIRVSKVVDKKPTADGKTREPANICTVADAMTGEQFIFIVPAVVRENLVRDYPNDSYVDKVFWIENKGKRTENQRYNDFAISEVNKV